MLIGLIAKVILGIAVADIGYNSPQPLGVIGQLSIVYITTDEVAK
jgi:hypothetical protein